MPEMDLRTAVIEAIAQEMERDPAVVLFSEDVAAAGGVFQATRGLHARYGPERVFDTPISELALVGAAYGSAIAGLRPIIEIMFGDFMPLAMDGLINQAAKYWYLSNGQQSVPLVVRSAVGAGGRFGAIHSQTPASWLLSVPGLKIVAPATPGDAFGLLAAAIRDPNPVVFLEHKRLYTLKGPVDGAVVPLGSARVARAGTDLTIVSAMRSLHEALAAADMLAEHGVDAEVIDLRTLRPLDTGTILESVTRTGRLLVVEEGPRTGGWAAEVIATVVEEQRVEAWRLAMPDLPLPYSAPMEDAALPDRDRIVDSVLARVGHAAGQLT